MVKEKDKFLRVALVGAFCVVVLFAAGSIKFIADGETAADSVAANIAEIPVPTLTPQIVQEENVVERNLAEKKLVEKTGSVSPIVSPAATAKNVEFQNNLQWNFGAKTQRGWYLYISLIQNTIGTEAGAETPEFARAVAAWQQKEGIYPTGIVDSETLSQMIKFWQSRRLNSSAYAALEDLMSAPINDFYDPTREADLLKVERGTYRAYKRMVSAAANDLKLRVDKNGELFADERYLRIISAFRSREYQNKLRAASPHSGRAGLAVNSPHFTGRALDIYVGGEPTITKDFNRAAQVRTPVYRWLVKNASRFGFYPYFYEPWHWEYVPQNSGTSNTSPPLPQK